MGTKAISHLPKLAFSLLLAITLSLLAASTAQAAESTSVDGRFGLLASNWESESNDSIASANSIAVNATWYGCIQSNGDNDYYRFTLPSAGRVSVSFSHPMMDDRYDMWYAELRDSSDGYLYEFGFYGTATSSTSMNVGLPAGTYYLKVYPNNYNCVGKDYSLAVNFAQSANWERERNDTIAQSNPIAPSARYYGVSGSNSDKDYYRFTLPSAGRVSVSFSHPMMDDRYDMWYAELRDSSDGYLYEFGFYGTATSSTSMNVGLPAGTYYLKVYPNNYNCVGKDYSLAVNFAQSANWERERNDSITKSTAAAVGVRYYGVCGGNDDHDYYKIQISTKAKYSINLQHPKLDSSYKSWDMTIKNSTGDFVQELDFSGTTTSSTKSVVLSKGTYYLDIQPNSSDCVGKDYSLMVYRPLPSGVKIAYSSTTYTGTAKTPTVTVPGLKKGTHYKVAYSNNKVVGVAKVTITGTGVYGGSVTKSFKINPKGTSLKKVAATSKGFKATWTKQATQTTGYQIRYSAKSSMSGAKTATVSKSKTTSVMVKKLAAKKKYYVQVRTYKTVKGTKYYSAWSAKKSVITKR